MNRKLLSLLVTLVAMFGCLGSAKAQEYKGGQLTDGHKYYVQNVAYNSFISGTKSTSQNPGDALLFTYKEDGDNKFLYTTSSTKAVLNPYIPGIGDYPGLGAQLRIELRTSNNSDYLYYIEYRRWAVVTWAYAYLGEDGNRNLNKKSDGKNDNNYTWRIIPATEANLAVSGEAHFGTFVAPFEVTLPDNVTAHKVTGIEDNDANIVSIGTTVPANTPVILNNSTDALITQTYYGLATGTPNANGNGYLIGVYEDGTVSSEAGYILQYRDNECVFLKGAGQSIVKNRAYLNASKVSDTKIRMVFADEVTSISSAENSVNITAIYSLSGAKLDKMQKGVNIVKMSDGTVKKVTVK